MRLSTSVQRRVCYLLDNRHLAWEIHATTRRIRNARDLSVHRCDSVPTRLAPTQTPHKRPSYRSEECYPQQPAKPPTNRLTNTSTAPGAWAITRLPHSFCTRVHHLIQTPEPMSHCRLHRGLPRSAAPHALRQWKCKDDGYAAPPARSAGSPVVVIRPGRAGSSTVRPRSSVRLQGASFIPCNTCSRRSTLSND